MAAPSSPATAAAPAVELAPAAASSAPAATSSSPKRISLGAELVKAITGGFAAGVGSFTGAITVATASSPKALAAAGIGSGIVFLAFVGNSLNNWLNQQG